MEMFVSMQQVVLGVRWLCVPLLDDQRSIMNYAWTWTWRQMMIYLVFRGITELLKYFEKPSSGQSIVNYSVFNYI